MTGRDKLLTEALKVAKKSNYNGIFLMPTGSGKGRFMIEIIKILKPKNVLYLCDREELRDKMFPHELHKWDAAHLLPSIDRVCYQTAYKWKDREYDIVLGDEFDAALSDKYSLVFKNNIFKHKILVSATLEDNVRWKAKQIAPIVFEKTQKELIETNVLNKIQYYFINFNLTNNENKKYIEYSENFTKLLNQPQTAKTIFLLNRLQINRKQFLSGLDSSAEVVKWLLCSLRKRNEKILIFTGLSKQADKVSVNSYHSNNNNLEALRNFETDIIKELVVVEKVTRGVNIKDVRNIILEHFGRSKTKFTQKVGRGLRLDIDEILNLFILVPYYIDKNKNRKATIIADWVVSATKDMDLSNAKTINYGRKNN